MNILVIEDSRSFAEVLRQTISPAGHLVVLAYDMASALAYLDLSPADAIVVDLQLPDSPIVQTAALLPRLRGRCERLIVITGHAVDAVALADAGATTVIPKNRGPRFFRDLLEALNGEHEMWGEASTPT